MDSKVFVVIKRARIIGGKVSGCIWLDDVMDQHVYYTTQHCRHCSCSYHYCSLLKWWLSHSSCMMSPQSPIMSCLSLKQGWKGEKEKNCENEIDDDMTWVKQRRTCPRAAVIVLAIMSNVTTWVFSHCVRVRHRIHDRNDCFKLMVKSFYFYMFSVFFVVFTNIAQVNKSKKCEYHMIMLLLFHSLML